MNMSSIIAMAQECVPQKASQIKSARERFDALADAPNELIAERRKGACKDAEIAELRAALELHEKMSERKKVREVYIKDMEDTLTQIASLVGVGQDADKIIRAVADLVAVAKRAENSHPDTVSGANTASTYG